MRFLAFLGLALATAVVAQPIANPNEEKARDIGSPEIEIAAIN